MPALEAACTDPLLVTMTQDQNDGVCTADDCSLREAVITANACSGHQTVLIPAGTYPLTLPGAGESQSASGDLNILESVTLLPVGAPVIIDGGGIDRVFHIQTGIPASDPVVLNGLKIQGGQAAEGGGLILSAGSHLHLIDMIVSGNQAGSTSGPGVGGGIYAGGSLILQDTTIENNVAYGEGGGLFIGAGGNVSVVGQLTVRANQALDGYSGGGVFNLGVADLSGVFEQNTSEWVGGAIRNNGQMELHEAEIIDNVAESGGGGVANTARLNMGHNNVHNNQSTIGGGVLQWAMPGSSRPPLLSLWNSEITQNAADVAGGGVHNSGGPLVLREVTIADNMAASEAGGIYSMDQLIIYDSTISGNEAGGLGGGGVVIGHAMRVSGTTFSGNVAPGYSGRGLEAGGAAISIRSGGEVTGGNLTFSGNQISSGQGAVVDNYFGLLNLGAATFADNAAFAFGGPSGDVNATQVTRSIIVNNGFGGPQCVEPIFSAGFNLLADDSCGAVGSDIVLRPGADPGLGPLGDNGGPTQTHALLIGSPAIDAAPDPCSGWDQRKLTRPQGEACDIGAYEREIQEIATADDGSDKLVAEPSQPAACYGGPDHSYQVLTTWDLDAQLEVLARTQDSAWLRVVAADEEVAPCWVEVELLDLPTAPPLDSVPVEIPPSTPIEVNFNADAYTLSTGECTRLRWEVINADATQLDQVPVASLASEQVCPSATTTYRLTAQNDVESAEAFVTIAVIAGPPTAPSDLSHKETCTNTGYSVGLNWIDRANNELGFRIFRDGALIATLGENESSYTDDAGSGGPYVYGVEAYNDAGASSRLATVAAQCIVLP